MSVLGNYIGGQHVASQSGRTAPVFNPATGSQSKEVALSSATKLGQPLPMRRKRLKPGARLPRLIGSYYVQVQSVG